jgi:hypothetical protein
MVSSLLTAPYPLARIPIRRNRLIEKNTRQLNNLEHVLIRKVEPLFGHAPAAGVRQENRPRKSPKKIALGALSSRSGVGYIPYRQADGRMSAAAARIPA